MELDDIIALMEKAGTVFHPGLSASELQVVEEMWQLHFPPDLRALLQRALPVSDGWYDWRTYPNEAIAHAILWPEEGILFDIEHNAFWPGEWGSKPANKQEAFSIARKHIREAPKLIPLTGHRYLPSEPCESGNPVFSVHQTDIIYYGDHLFEYLANEYSYYFHGLGATHQLSQSVKDIRFWSWMVFLNE